MLLIFLLQATGMSLIPEKLPGIFIPQKITSSFPGDSHGDCIKSVLIQKQEG